MRWRYVALAVVGVVVLGVGGTIALFDPETQKPRIIAAVKQATGRDLQLRGRIGLVLALHPTIEVNDAALSNPPGFSRPNMATMEKLELRLGLLPLLSRRIEIDRLIVTKPDIKLETDAAGQGNWVFVRPEPGVGAPATTGKGGGSAQPMAVMIGEIRLDNGQFAYRDGKTGQTHSVTAREIASQTAALDTPFRLTANLTLDGADIALTAETGPLSKAGGDGPWPIKLAATVVGANPVGIAAELRIDGTFSRVQGINFGLSADIPELTALAPLIGQPLPAVTSITVRARVAGALPVLALRDLKVTSSAGDLAGDISYAPGTPANISGTLTAGLIDIDQLMRPAPAKALTPPPLPNRRTKPAPAPSKWLMPDDPLPFGNLQLHNADLHASVGVLRFGGADYKSLEAHLLLKDGELTLDPAHADLPAGHVALTLRADAGKPEPPVHLTLHAPGIALQPLLTALGQPPYISGNMELDADLRGKGESPHAIAASLSGHIGLAVPGGTIDLKRISGAGAKAIEALNPATSAAGANVLRCLALRLDFTSGVGSVKALALGSALVNADGTGSLSMAEETLALELHSRTSVGGAAVTVPVHVTGPWLTPRIKVDGIGLAQSNITALGGVLGIAKQPSVDGDVCPSALAVARGQPAPEPTLAPETAPSPPPQSPGPEQLFKKLFRQ